MSSTPLFVPNRPSTPTRSKSFLPLKKIHKEFNLRTGEEVICRCFCSLEGKTSFEGEAVLFRSCFCFISHSQARVVKVSIPLTDITELETKMSSLIIPNQIKIGTKLKTYIFVVDSQERDELFKYLLEHWKLTSITKKYGNITEILDNITKRINNVKETLQQHGIRYNVDPSLDAFLYTTLKLPQTEALINHFACAQEEGQGRVAVPAGRLYITQNYIVFHENIRFVTRARHEVIEFSSISSIEKRNSHMWSLPNAIEIITYSKKLFLSSFFNRNETYDLLKDCWHASRQRKGLVIEDENSSSEEDEEHRSDEEFSPDDYDDEDAPMSYFEMQGYSDVSPDNITLDLYGFEVPEQYVEQYHVEIAKYPKTLARQRRAWRNFRATNNMDSHIQHHTPELMRMIQKGIPFELRGELWYQFSGAIEKKEASTIGYHELLTKKTSYLSDIGKDLRRTFPYHPAYQSDESLQRLEHVLVAFANRNPSIGYCQSMNFVTALLLLFMPEEDAFWVLVTIVEDRLQDYFSESMVGTIVDQEVFEELLKQKFPLLMEHIEDRGLPLAVVTTRWFMCLYIGALPTETVLRVWDLFFFHGSPVIITTALSLIKMYEDDIFTIVNTEKFMSYSVEFGMSCFNVETLFRITFNVVGLLDNRHLNYIRARYWETTKDLLEVENKKRDIYLLERSTHYSAKELETWYKEWCDAKLHAVQTKRDCTPRDSLGVDFDAFSEMVEKLAPTWSSDDAAELLKRLFDYLDSNNDNLLDFKEMVNGISVISRGTTEEKIELFFKMFGQKRQPLNNEQFMGCLLALYKLYYHNDYPSDIKEMYKDRTSVNLSALIDLVEELPIFNRSQSQPIRTSSGRIISQEAKPVPMSPYSIHEDYIPARKRAHTSH